MVFFGELRQGFFYRFQCDKWESFDLPEELNGIDSGTRCVFINPSEILISGGKLGSRTYLFNLRKIKVYPRKSMKVSRANHELLVQRERVFALSGYSQPERSCTDKCEVYDFGLDRWTEIKHMNLKRQNFGAFLLPNE